MRFGSRLNKIACSVVLLTFSLNNTISYSDISSTNFRTNTNDSVSHARTIASANRLSHSELQSLFGIDSFNSHIQVVRSELRSKQSVILRNEATKNLQVSDPSLSAQDDTKSELRNESQKSRKKGGGGKAGETKERTLASLQKMVSANRRFATRKELAKALGILLPNLSRYRTEDPEVKSQTDSLILKAGEVSIDGILTDLSGKSVGGILPVDSLLRRLDVPLANVALIRQIQKRGSHNEPLSIEPINPLTGSFGPLQVDLSQVALEIITKNRDARESSPEVRAELRGKRQTAADFERRINSVIKQISEHKIIPKWFKPTLIQDLEKAKRMFQDGLIFEAAQALMMIAKNAQLREFDNRNLLSGDLISLALAIERFSLKEDLLKWMQRPKTMKEVGTPALEEEFLTILHQLYGVSFEAVLEEIKRLPLNRRFIPKIDPLFVDKINLARETDVLAMVLKEWLKLQKPETVRDLIEQRKDPFSNIDHWMKFAPRGGAVALACLIHHFAMIAAQKIRSELRNKQPVIVRSEATKNLQVSDPSPWAQDGKQSKSELRNEKRAKLPSVTVKHPTEFETIIMVGGKEYLVETASLGAEILVDYGFRAWPSNLKYHDRSRRNYDWIFLDLGEENLKAIKIYYPLKSELRAMSRNVAQKLRELIRQLDDLITAVGKTSGASERIVLFQKIAALAVLVDQGSQEKTIKYRFFRKAGIYLSGKLANIPGLADDHLAEITALHFLFGKTFTHSLIAILGSDKKERRLFALKVLLKSVQQFDQIAAWVRDSKSFESAAGTLVDREGEIKLADDIRKIIRNGSAAGATRSELPPSSITPTTAQDDDATHRRSELRDGYLVAGLASGIALGLIVLARLFLQRFKQFHLTPENPTITIHTSFLGMFKKSYQLGLVSDEDESFIRVSQILRNGFGLKTISHIFPDQPEGVLDQEASYELVTRANITLQWDSFFESAIIFVKPTFFIFNHQPHLRHESASRSELRDLGSFLTVGITVIGVIYLLEQFRQFVDRAEVKYKESKLTHVTRRSLAALDQLLANVSNRGVIHDAIKTLKPDQLDLVLNKLTSALEAINLSSDFAYVIYGIEKIIEKLREDSGDFTIEIQTAKKISVKLGLEKGAMDVDVPSGEGRFLEFVVKPRSAVRAELRMDHAMARAILANPMAQLTAAQTLAEIDPWSKFGDETIELDLDKRLFNALLRSLRPWIGEGARTLVNLGSGEGGWSRILKGSFHELEIVDVDQSAFEPSKRALPFVRGNIEDLRGLIPDDSFDIAMSMFAVDYTNEDRSIEELKRIVRGGGHALLFFHHPQSSRIQKYEKNNEILKETIGFLNDEIERLRIGEKPASVEEWAVRAVRIMDLNKSWDPGLLENILGLLFFYYSGRLDWQQVQSNELVLRSVVSIWLTNYQEMTLKHKRILEKAIDPLRVTASEVKIKTFLKKHGIHGAEVRELTITPNFRAYIATFSVQKSSSNNARSALPPPRAELRTALEVAGIIAVAAAGVWFLFKWFDRGERKNRLRKEARALGEEAEKKFGEILTFLKQVKNREEILRAIDNHLKDVQLALFIEKIHAAFEDFMPDSEVTNRFIGIEEVIEAVIANPAGDFDVAIEVVENYDSDGFDYQFIIAPRSELRNKRPVILRSEATKNLQVSDPSPAAQYDKQSKSELRLNQKPALDSRRETRLYKSGIATLTTSLSERTSNSTTDNRSSIRSSLPGIGIKASASRSILVSNRSTSAPTSRAVNSGLSISSPDANATLAKKSAVVNINNNEQLNGDSSYLDATKALDGNAVATLNDVITQTTTIQSPARFDQRTILVLGPSVSSPDIIRIAAGTGARVMPLVGTGAQAALINQHFDALGFPVNAATTVNATFLRSELRKGAKVVALGLKDDSEVLARLNRGIDNQAEIRIADTLDAFGQKFFGIENLTSRLRSELREAWFTAVAA